MKTFKKCMMVISALVLTASLSACGNKKDEGYYTVSNVLNSKKSLPIIVTDKYNQFGKDHVVWAGYIGQGKIKGIHLDGTDYNFGYKDLKKLNGEKYSRSLTDMGKDYFDGVNPTKFVSSKAETVLKPNGDGKKAEGVSLNFLKSRNGKSYVDLKEDINQPIFSHVSEKKDGEWATIKSNEKDKDYGGYQMHIKLGEGKRANFKLEDIKKATHDYDNVKIAEDDSSEG